MNNDFFPIRAPDYYPDISESAIEGAFLVFRHIRSSFSATPSSVDPSVEGGIALLYRRKSGQFFKKRNRELFIEIYDKESIIMAIIEDGAMICVKETTSDDDTSLNEYFKIFYTEGV